jgi:putative endonuclease
MESNNRTWRQRLGNRAEDAAASYLQAQGARILLRNFRCRCGELDIVAQLGEDELAIVEVRTRSSQAYGGAAASVDAGKRQRLIRAASRLLQQRKDLARLRARFDVIVVCDPFADAPQIEWIKHAFSCAARRS